MSKKVDDVFLILIFVVRLINSEMRAIRGYLTPSSLPGHNPNLDSNSLGLGPRFKPS